MSHYSFHLFIYSSVYSFLKFNIKSTKDSAIWLHWRKSYHWCALRGVGWGWWWGGGWTNVSLLGEFQDEKVLDAHHPLKWEKKSAAGDDWGGILRAQMAISSKGDGGGQWDRLRMARKKPVAFGRWVRGLVKVQAVSPHPCWVLARLLVHGFSLLGNSDITVRTGWVGLTLPILIQEVIIVLATTATLLSSSTPSATSGNQRPASLH